MKYIYKFLILFGCILGLAACNFLDIVPDEKEKAEDAFEDVRAAERFLYSCYAYLPQPRAGASSLDLMTGDEVITAFEHETFASFPKGNFTASNPVISYWNTLFQGIRQCYILLNNIDTVPNLEEDIKIDYKAQAKFLIGYYHFLLVRSYGPSIILTEEADILTPAENYLPRTNYDDCVKFVCDIMDSAAEDLPNSRPILYYGFATKVVAKCVKARMLLTAASPLFNGNSKFYSNFKDKEGNLLMPIEYDPNKWEKAKEAYKEAIDVAHASGASLYTETDHFNGNKEPLDPHQHCLRYNIIVPGNPEILWADARGEGYYGIQNKTTPFCSGSAWNGISPTLNMLKRFYTKNGLPYDQDPEIDMSNPFEPVTVDEDHATEAEVGQQTARFNLDREPRFYAWIGFQGGYYEILSAQSNGAYHDDASYKKYSKAQHGKLVCNFLKGGNTSRGDRTNNYAPSGYLNKKGVDPGFAVAKSLKHPIKYPWPIFRLAELYLGYAEACVECGDLNNAKIYLNKVRERAGIPSVEESWETIAGKKLDQKLLREVVRQERQIEFYLENQNFWDMRRWLMAEKYFNQKAQGLEISSPNISGFNVVTEIPFERKFESPTQYLMPIPIDDIRKNEHIVQNPGY